MATVTAVVDQLTPVTLEYPSIVLQSTSLFAALLDLQLDHDLLKAFRPTVNYNLHTFLDAFIKGPGCTVVKLDSSDGAHHATVTIKRIAT